MLTPEYLIGHFRMTRHPEGGYFVETYRSHELVERSALPERFSGNRTFSTAIYFLLVGDEFSSFHRIKSDETWHFYAGVACEVVMIAPDGTLSVVLLGNEPEKGHCFQFTVPAGYWFASACTNPDAFSFVGCTVAPGFDFSDFELAKQEELITMFPQHSKKIKDYCRQ